MTEGRAGHAPQARGDARAAPVRAGSLVAGTECRRTRSRCRAPTDRSIRTSTPQSDMAHRGRSQAIPTRWLRRQPTGPAMGRLLRLQSPKRTLLQGCETASRLATSYGRLPAHDASEQPTQPSQILAVPLACSRVLCDNLCAQAADDKAPRQRTADWRRPTRCGHCGRFEADIPQLSPHTEF